MRDRLESRPDFNTAGTVLPASTSDAGLIVDVQLGCITHMLPMDAENYLSSLGARIEDMRRRNVPITWATVDDPAKTKFHAPTGRGEQIRPHQDFVDTGFYAVAPDKNPDAMPNKAAFDKFITEHGPRRNEAIFTKPAFNSFGTSERDRTDANIPASEMPRIEKEHKKLITHLRAQGSENLAIFGAVGSVCCLETAIGGHQNGFKTSLMLDGIVCWRGEGQKSHLIWCDGFENAEAAAEWQRSEVNAAPHKPSRGFSEAEIQSAAQVTLQTYDEFIGSKSAPAKSAENRLKM